MKTTNFPALNARCAAIILIAAGLGLAGLPARAETSGPVKLDDAKLDEFTVERAGMFEITPPAKKKITLDAAAKDPLAAERAGLWVGACKGPARKISLEEAKKDPLAAERAGLWDVAAKKCCVTARK